MSEPRAFQWEVLEGRVGLITFDQPGKKVNTLAYAVLRELDVLLSRVEVASGLRGLILRSGKPGQFVAGADLKEIADLAGAPVEQVERGSAFGQELFERIARLPYPTVALVDGPCMGGGAELALAFDERVLSAGGRTRIGFPEITVGLIPAWGGTQRLPRMMGLGRAVELITTGGSMLAAEAIRLGLAHAEVPPERLLEEGRTLMDALADAGEWQARRIQRHAPVALSKDEEDALFAAAETALRGSKRRLEPAPWVALAAIQRGLRVPFGEALAIERDEARHVFGSPEATNLIQFFFESTRLTRGNGVEDPSVRPREVARIGLLFWPYDIEWKDQSEAFLRRAGHDVRVFDAHALEPGLDAVDLLLADVRAIPIDQVIPSQEPSGIRVVSRGPRLDELVEHLRPPAAIAGLTLIGPTERMPVVELVRWPQTTDEAVVTAVSVLRASKLTPIVTRYALGGLIGRLSASYGVTGLELWKEGTPAAAVDAAAEAFGFERGPFAHSDWVGVQWNYDLTGDPPPRSKPDAPCPKPGPLTPAEIQERLLLNLLAVSVHVLEEGAVSRPEELDLASVLTIGFPAVQGGILRWADRQGLDALLARMVELRQVQGCFPLFGLLEQMVVEGKSFYPAAGGRSAFGA
ncbi:MAG: enoyl-CoA hydratase-related protein [Isosphaeraceae bacterium]